MNFINNYCEGIFTVNPEGKVKVDLLYNGGWYRGELAIFSLAGIENIAVDSTEFLQEAAKRALSNSERGYIVVPDETDSSGFGNFSNELTWEGQFDDDTYEGARSFLMQAGDRFAMMLVTYGSVKDIAANPNKGEVLFSFATFQLQNGETIAQIADLTGNGTIFGWEIDHFNYAPKLNREYHDFVIEVNGAATTATNLGDWIFCDRDSEIGIRQNPIKSFNSAVTCGVI